MPTIRHTSAPDAAWTHRAEHEGYAYEKQKLVSRREAKQCTASMMKIPPKKAGYPYHFHILNEECFFILSGVGLLRSPDGEQEVTAGDFLFFPRGDTGAHKLTNTSETEPLVYLDFDTANDPEVSFYPDSQKVGVWGEGISQLYFTRDKAGYYDGE